MRIDKTQKVAGYPLLRIRDFLKKHEQFSYRSVTGFFEVEAEEANKIIESLLNDGYIQPVPDERRLGWDKTTVPFEHTPRGRSLSLARATSPMSREKAEKLLADFMSRVNTINSSDEYLYKIKKVLVFGSYLRKEVTELGDLDLAVEFAPAYPKPIQVQKEQALVKAAAAAGKRFDRYIDELFYAQSLVQKFLRNKSPYISLHGMDDDVLNQTETKQLFP